ncbi:MAG: YceD family protein [Bradymonadia bacterium]
MRTLPLNFTLHDLAEGACPFKGELDAEKVGLRVSGLVGKLGYRVVGPASAEGMAYLAQKEVVIDAQIKAEVGFDCVRCLNGRALSVSQRVHVVIAPEPEGGVPEEGEITVEDGVEDTDMAYYTGDEVKLEELLLEYIVLEMPMNPSCESEGIMPGECGKAALEALEQQQQEQVDPRWAPLAAMKAAMEAESDEGEESKD